MPALINLREVPLIRDPALYDFLLQLRNIVVNQVQYSVVEPRPVVNFSVTPGPGSNFVQFTRSDGDAYAVYENGEASLNGATRHDVGLANVWMHDIGEGGVLRYYWVKTKLGQLESIAVGPIGATTLALTDEITIPPEVAPSENLTRSQETDSVIPGKPAPAFYQEIL
jgi:hypothetical protein